MLLATSRAVVPAGKSLMLPSGSFTMIELTTGIVATELLDSFILGTKPLPYSKGLALRFGTFAGFRGSNTGQRFCYHFRQNSGWISGFSLASCCSRFQGSRLSSRRAKWATGG